MPIVNENEQNRYRNKIGRLQYLRDARVRTGGSVVMSNDFTDATYQPSAFGEEISEIIKKVSLIDEQYKDLNAKFEAFTNGTIPRADETGIVVYNASENGGLSKGEKYLEESKGFLGIGKGKMIEKTVK